MDLHPIEAAWLRFRNSARAELLCKYLEARQSYLRFIGLGQLPNEIVLPGAVVWNLAAIQEARAQGETRGEMR